MVIKRRDHESAERLDSLASDVVRALATNSSEAESVANSPFLYTRIRSRIDAERKRREEGEGWLAMLGVIWRTVPAMALVAVLAVVMFLSTASTPIGPSNTNYDSLLGERDGADEQMVFADRQSVSSDDVLETIFSEDEQGASK